MTHMTRQLFCLQTPCAPDFFPLLTAATQTCVRDQVDHVVLLHDLRGAARLECRQGPQDGRIRPKRQAVHAQEVATLRVAQAHG